MAKYLVTGGAGFIGSNLVDKLVSQDHQVEVWDNLSTGKESNVHNASFYYVDVGNGIQNVDVGIYDAIFHLAGEARIQPSFNRPVECHKSNVTGTLNILELARKYQVPVVYAGSSSVYSNQYSSPYTFTKAKAEEYCWLYNKVYGVPVAIARFFNVYGPRQILQGPYATVIGIFEQQKLNNLPLTITGDGDQRRDFTHVEDVCDGLIAITKDKAYGEMYDFGSGKNYSINEVAKMFDSSIEYIPARRGEARDTLANINFTNSVLDWNPKKSLSEYISNFISTVK